jgi:hypothetical protein
MRGHMLELDLLTLDPKIFDNIQDFFTKFKDLLSQLKACRVDKSKEEKQMVLTILSRLGPELSIFISTFHTVRFTFEATWKMPYLEVFIESLTQEQTKLNNMGTTKFPRAHALTVHDGSCKYHKYKDKYKRKSHAHLKREGYTKPFTDASRSKGEKGRKGEKCTYCHKGLRMTNNYGTGKKFIFTPNSMYIYDMKTNSRVVIGEVNHQSMKTNSIVYILHFMNSLNLIFLYCLLMLMKVVGYGMKVLDILILDTCNILARTFVKNQISI